MSENEEVVSPFEVQQAADPFGIKMRELFDRAVAAGLPVTENAAILAVASEQAWSDGRDCFGYQRTNTPPPARERMLRVESDGTPMGTHVFLGDVEIAMVQDVKLELTAGDIGGTIVLRAIVGEVSINTNKKEQV